MAWYDKKWVIILFLVFLFPVGLLLMWRSPLFGKTTKILVTAFFVLMIFAGDSNKEPTKSTQQSSPATSTVQQTTQKPADEAKIKEAIQETTQAPPPKPAPAPVKFPDLGMTVAQFKNAFATVASSYGIPQFNINNAVYKQGSVQDMLECKFSTNVSLSCQVNKSNGLIRTANVTLIPLRDGDSATAFMIYEILVTIFNPELTQDERNSLFDELCLVEDKILALQDSSPKAIRGNRKYSVVYIKTVDSVGMLLWSISNSDDN